MNASRKHHENSAAEVSLEIAEKEAKIAAKALQQGDLKAADTAAQIAEDAAKKAVTDIERAEHKVREIHFEVDGEKYETREHELTPNEIIRRFGGQDPATNYLVQIKHGEKVKSYEGKGDKPIKLHDGEKFQIISTGPTPVSDGPIQASVETFMIELRDLGYQPSPLPGKPDHIIFPYEVQSGRFAGQAVTLGLIVPADWKMTPPSGPHVSPQVLPIKSGGDHPSGQVHPSDFGNAFEYWSRPYSGWEKTKRSVAVYMNHIFRLWHTQ